MKPKAIAAQTLMDAIFHVLIFTCLFSCRVSDRRLKNIVTQAYILFFLIYSSAVLLICSSQDKEESMKVQLIEELWKYIIQKFYAIGHI